MALKFLSGLDLGQNAVVNLVFENKATLSAPSSPVSGQVYYDTDENKAKIYDATGTGEWKDFGVTNYATTTLKGLVQIGDTMEMTGGIDLDVKGGALTNTHLSASAAIALTKLANIANNTIIGNNSGSAGSPTALNATNIRSIINVENGATADQTDSEIETAYNNQVSQVSANEITAGTSTTIKRYSPANIKSFVDTHQTDEDVSKANLKSVLATLDSNDTTYIGDSDVDTTVVIRGNLTVSGTTTTIDSNTISVGDNIIVLNNDLGASSSPTEDAGIEVNRGNATNAKLYWDESALRWTMDDGGTTYQIPTADTQRSDEAIYDLASALLTTNASHTNITATKDDAGNGVDLSVATATSSVIGLANVAAGDGIDVTVSSGTFTVTAEDASATNPGVVELATDAETTTGTDTSRATTPANVKAAIDARSYKTTIAGTGSKTNFAVTHNLGSVDTIVQITDYGDNGTGATYATVYADVTRAANTVTIDFGVAPASTQDYRVLVYKVV